MNAIHNTTKTVRTVHTAATLAAVVLRVLDANPRPLTREDLALAIGVSTSRARIALLGLMSVGLVVDVGSTCIHGSGSARTYRSVGHAPAVPVVVRAKMCRDDVLTALRGGPLTTTQLRERTGYHAETLHSALRKMEEARLVSAIAFGRGGLITWARIGGVA